MARFGRRPVLTGIWDRERPADLKDPDQAYLYLREIESLGLLTWPDGGSLDELSDDDIINIARQTMVGWVRQVSGVVH